MTKYILSFLFSLITIFSFGQEKKDFRMGIETTGVMTIQVGNNYMSEGLDNLYGFGVGLDFIFIKKGKTICF